jgi:hypothetical protein
MVAPAALAFVLPILASAPQDPTRADIEAPVLAAVTRRLASRTAAEVAWGAHLAGKHGLELATAPLREALQRWRAVEGDEARQVRLHLVDALWQLKAVLPHAEYEFLLDDPLTRVPAFLIAASDVKGNKDLLARIAMRALAPDDLVAYAAGGLLVDGDHRQEDFVRHLLTVARWRVLVHVTDEGGELSDGGFGTRADVLLPAAGFPRLVRHRLTDYHHRSFDLRGAAIVRLGDTRDRAASTEDTEATRVSPMRVDALLHESTVLHRRDEVPSLDRRELTNLPQVAPGPDTAVRWLRLVAGVELPVANTHMNCQWDDEAAFRGAIDRARTTQTTLRARIDGLLPALVFRKWLATDGTPAFDPVIALEVLDERGDRATPLPKIEGTNR